MAAFHPSPCEVAEFLAGLEPRELVIFCLQMIRATGCADVGRHPVISEFRQLYEAAGKRPQSQQTLQAQMLQAPALADLVGPEVASNLRRRQP